MDEMIKAKVEEIVKKIQADPALLKEFTENPTAAVEKLVGVELPAGSADAIAAAVKGHLEGGDAVDLLKKLGGLFGK